MKSSVRTALLRQASPSEIPKHQLLVSSEGNHTHHSSEGTFWPDPQQKTCQSDPPISQLAGTQTVLGWAMRCAAMTTGRGDLFRDNSSQESIHGRNPSCRISQVFPGSPGRMDGIAAARDEYNW